MPGMPASDERKRKKYPRKHDLRLPPCPRITNAGNPCSNPCQIVEIRGKHYKLNTCIMHSSRRIKDELGLARPGFQPGGGRKKKPHPLEVLRERFEEEADRYLQTFEDALVAMKAVVVGNGASAHIEYTEDIALQLRALESILDRIYGRPKQVQEITGADGGPMEVQVPNDDERKKALAAILASTGALSIPQNASASAPTTN